MQIQNNLLFYDFNSGARHFRFGTNNVRLATKGEFRRTGMAGAQNVDKHMIDVVEVDHKLEKRRPITSHFRCGDRLPSRASKTRDKAKRIYIGARKKPAKRQQQGLPKPDLHTHESMSPKHGCAPEGNDNHRHVRQNVYTALPHKKQTMFEDLNSETTEPESSKNYKFRERIGRKKDIIIEEEEDNEEDLDKYSQHI